ncbi:hypothetical protein HSR121_0445 [Halapricum desulfuricans]|uniref:Uncharacterized protein n=1 Tax=Halapricum desulfuricans TaxID=2841257 RepID=A0A897MWZ5_9EURY|nr:hypothetical protein HSR121_0445 [Halapricum desulfuricans]
MFGPADPDFGLTQFREQVVLYRYNSLAWNNPITLYLFYTW